jgi:hypothetical protein
MWTFLLIPFFLFGVEIELGGHVLNVEIADTKEARNCGLAGREVLPEGNGMLFVFETPQVPRFWMKDVKIPLAVGFFDEYKRLLSSYEMDLIGEHAIPVIYSCGLPILYALEVPKGWFQSRKIKPGTPFQFKNPSQDQNLPVK